MARTTEVSHLHTQSVSIFVGMMSKGVKEAVGSPSCGCRAGFSLRSQIQAE